MLKTLKVSKGGQIYMEDPINGGLDDSQSHTSVSPSLSLLNVLTKDVMVKDGK